MNITKSKTTYNISHLDSRVILTVDHINNKCEVLIIRCEQYSDLDKRALELGEMILKIESK